MTSARITITSEVVGPVSPNIFGALTEHFGRTVYGGLWDAERDQPRADVQAAVRALGTTMYRYPGGCFSAWYHWRDGVGPKEERPRHERTFWTDFGEQQSAGHEGVDAEEIGRLMGPPEPNLFGTDELLQYCVDTGAAPLLVTNCGSADADEASAWVRYCNAERRGLPRVDWWAVGNENWGTHELGHSSASDYGMRLAEFSTAMRAEDPTIKIVGVGAPPLGLQPVGESGPFAIDGAGWNAAMLAQAADHIDALSLHWYFPGLIGRELRDDIEDFAQVATGADLLGRILDKTIEEIDAATSPDSRLSISLDEWNRMVTFPDHFATNHRICDGLLHAGVIHQILRRADRVKLAMVSHLVNCLAPIQTAGDRMFVTAGYLVLLLERWATRGLAVRAEVETPTFEVAPLSDLDDAIFTGNADEVREAAVVDAAVTRDDRGTTVHVSNRALKDAIELEVHGLMAGGTGVLRSVVGAGPFDQNTIDEPGRLRFRDEIVTSDARGVARLVLAPATAGVVMMGGRA